MKDSWEGLFLMDGDAPIGAKLCWFGISESYGARSPGSFEAQGGAYYGVSKGHTEANRSLVDIQTASYLAERNASHFNASTKRQIHHGNTDSSPPPQVISHATKKTPRMVDSQMVHNHRVLRRRGGERESLDHRSDIFVSASRSRETPCCSLSFFSSLPFSFC